MIGSIAYGLHLLVFRHYFSARGQLWYQALTCAVWLSYYLAIVTPPGLPPSNFLPRTGEWRRFCAKCNNYKPERTHHCRKCNTCVLQMDHHCPWTNNCVGHGNSPQFMRFLMWVLVGTLVTVYELYLVGLEFWEQRHLPAYLIDKTELGAVIVLGLGALFVLFAIAVLFVRCMANIVVGKTQIEVWETERIEGQFHTERLWHQIRANYRAVHGADMPPLVSWSTSTAFRDPIPESVSENESDNDEEPPLVAASEEMDKDGRIVPAAFTSDDLVFPYDHGVWRNVCAFMGSPLFWWWPWARAPGDGVLYARCEDDDQLNLPWPPDLGNADYTERTLTDDELRDLGDATLVKRYLDPRSTAPRTEWANDLGETLDDFGVDPEEETPELAV